MVYRISTDFLKFSLDKSKGTSYNPYIPTRKVGNKHDFIPSPLPMSLRQSLTAAPTVEIEKTNENKNILDIERTSFRRKTL